MRTLFKRPSRILKLTYRTNSQTSLSRPRFKAVRTPSVESHSSVLRPFTLFHVVSVWVVTKPNLFSQLAFVDKPRRSRIGSIIYGFYYGGRNCPSYRLARGKQVERESLCRSPTSQRCSTTYSYLGLFQLTGINQLYFNFSSLYFNSIKKPRNANIMQLLYQVWDKEMLYCNFQQLWNYLAILVAFCRKFSDENNAINHARVNTFCARWWAFERSI